MPPIIWVHGDCLNPHSPAFCAYPNAPAVFVWDDALLKETHISLKRIVFLYECLLELPVSIRRGNVVDEVVGFAQRHAADAIITVESPSPRFALITEQVRRVLPVTVLSLDPFAVAEGRLDLRRFARYWRAVEASAMRRTEVS